MTEIDKSLETEALHKIIEITKKEMENHGLQSLTMAKIMMKLQELHLDMHFWDVALNHLKILNELVSKVKDLYEGGCLMEEAIEFHISNFFINKMSLYDIHSPYPFQTNYVEDIPSLPIECFLKPDVKLTEAFGKRINKFDILYVEIINLEKAHDTIMVRIISKVDEANSFVYHLNIIAYMFKKEELSRLSLTDIDSSKLLKVAVIGTQTVKGVRKHYLTTNSSFLPQDKKAHNLGIMRPHDLPYNLNSFKVATNCCMNYTHYLRSNPNMFKFQNLKELIQSLGVDLYRIYSFFEERDGLEFPLDSCIDALNAKAELDLHLESKKHLEEAMKFIINKEYPSALSSFDESLKCWPRNYEVFEKRGKMYAGLIKEDYSNSRKAIRDFEDALSLNKSAQETKVEYSKLIVTIAKRERKQRKNLEKAKLYCDQAIKLDNKNENARKLMQLIEKDIKTKKEIRQLEIQHELLKKRLKTEK